MLSHAVFIALIALFASAAPVAINSSTFAFTRQHVLSGSVTNKSVDALVIEIKDASATTLKADLKNTSGDADLAIVTEVNKNKVHWTSQLSGDDYLEISASDYQLTDGLGLQHRFIVLVYGFAQEDSYYTLTVTVEGTSQWRDDSGVSLNKHVKALKEADVMTVSPFEGDVSPYLSLLEASENSYSWVYALGVATVVGAGAWVWRQRKVRKDEDYLRYSLIGS